MMQQSMVVAALILHGSRLELSLQVCSQWITNVYPGSIIVLLLLLTSTASDMVATVFNESIVNNTVSNQQISLTKKHYALLRGFIGDINDCFGFVLLIFITKTFITTVTLTYFHIDPFVTNLNLFFTMLLVKTVVYMLVLTITAEKLSKQVDEFDCIFKDVLIGICFLLCCHSSRS